MFIHTYFWSLIIKLKPQSHHAQESYHLRPNMCHQHWLILFKFGPLAAWSLSSAAQGQMLQNLPDWNSVSNRTVRRSNHMTLLQRDDFSVPELRYLKSYHQKLYYPCSIHPHLQITVSAGYLSSGSILTPASSLYRMIYLRLSLWLHSVLPTH